MQVSKSASDRFSLRFPVLTASLRTRRFWRLAALYALIVVLALGVSVATYQISQQLGLAELKSTGRYRLDLYSASLEREISKYAYFPEALGLERDVMDLLDVRLTGKVNRYLEELNERAGALSIYIMNRAGRVLASSNWRRADSFIGEDLSFRPYFRDAIENGRGRFFGIGTTKGEPGYYLSSALVEDGNIIGVAAVKVSLEQLEKSWATVEAPVFVADENGVIFLSSVADWKFKTLRPIDEAARRLFDETQQYNRRALPSIGVKDLDNLGGSAQIVRVPHEKNETVSVYPVAGRFLLLSKRFPGSNWALTVFSNLDQVDNISAIRAAVAGVSTVLLCILAIMFNERRRHLRDRLAAREALQKAHDELEIKVGERTRDLSSANQKLQAEVAERARAERTLREAQDELIQAGKLAVIGQLSASIAHELNQPLAALHTLSSNAARFLDRGDEGTARANLERIGQLVERMGVITRQLKTFARKSTGQPQTVVIRQVVTHAIALLDHRLRAAGVELIIDFAEPALAASCDANRLEQVIVNLLGNAIDAIAGQAAPVIEIAASRRQDFVCLAVRDHGAGLSDEIRARLFEPFFTTKAAGLGLGLGLAISAGIVSDFGGTLKGANHPQGGAVFTLEIPIAEDPLRP